MYMSDIFEKKNIRPNSSIMTNVSHNILGTTMKSAMNLGQDISFQTKKEKLS